MLSSDEQQMKVIGLKKTYAWFRVQGLRFKVYGISKLMAIILYICAGND